MSSQFNVLLLGIRIGVLVFHSHLEFTDFIRYLIQLYHRQYIFFTNCSVDLFNVKSSLLLVLECTVQNCTLQTTILENHPKHLQEISFGGKYYSL